MDTYLPLNKTNRGFAVANFVDHYGKSCSLQESSLATEDCIWLGCDELGLKRFTPGKGWEEVPLETGNSPDGVSYIANTRMHLNRKQVAALLPLLQTFVDTGELGQVDPA